MIEKEPDSFSDIVDRAMGELRSSPVPPEMPPELLHALLQAAKENTGVMQRAAEASAQAEIIHPTFPAHSLTNWQWMLHSSASRIVAAVFVFVVAGAALWFHVNATPSAFAEFIKPIVEAKSATFRVTFERNGKQVATGNGMWLPNRERMELQRPGQAMEIVIGDTSKGVGVTINSDKKTMVINKVVGLSREQATLDPLEEIRSLLLSAGKRDVKRESLGEKEVDGRRAVGWRVSGPGLHEPGVTATLWGDPQTGLPIRIETYSALEGVKSTLSDFAFNVELDESLFSVEPPAGYTVQTAEVDVSRPTENDLIALLREYSQWMNNAFPEALEMNRLVRTLGTRIRIGTMSPGNERPSDELLRRITAAGTEEETGKIIQDEFWKNEKKSQAELRRRIRNANPDKAQEMVDAAKNARQKALETFNAKWTAVYTIITRGLGFVVELPREADSHYAGQGISSGSPGTPIFWYRPKDATKYRVIYADLSVRAVGTPPRVSQAPPVPAASRPRE